jgi:tetratricopeptide (TPR) repeat protein
MGKLGLIGYGATAGALLAELLVAQGRDAEAERIAHEVEGMAQEDDVDPQARMRGVRALLLARKGQHDHALKQAREAVALFGATDYLNAHADMLVTLATVHRAADRGDEARAAFEKALALYERKGNLVMASRVRDDLAELVGSS